MKSLFLLLILFVMMIGVKAFLGVTFGGMFLALGGYLFPSASKDPSQAEIETGQIKVKWQGAASTGLLVAGVLMLILALLAFLDSHEII